MGIKYTNNSIKVKAALNNGVKQFLYEAGGELQSRIYRNSVVDSGQTKGSYQYKVDTGADESTLYIGSNYQNAIWEEYGTGEYALAGNGRKTPWVYRDSKGKWHRTRGKKARRPMFKAFTSLAGKLEHGLAEALKRNLGG